MNHANVRFRWVISFILPLVAVIAFVASLACLVSFTVYIGYDHTATEFQTLKRVIRVAQIIFIANVALPLIFDFRRVVAENRPIKWIVDVAVLLTFLPLVYPMPAHPWIPLLKTILYSNHFLFPVLAAYSVVDICYGIMRMMGRRVNPSLMLSASFLVFILIGSFLLMLPKCTYGGGISYVESLFVSTSAVCITGLTPVDVYVNFTPLGLLVLAVLIQIGGLGVLTFTSFFALFFAGNTSIYSQMIVRDLVYSKTMNSLIPTLLYIFCFTLTLEAAGAVWIFFCIHGQLGLTLDDEIMTACFNSLSAFCNAGFSNIPMGMANPSLLFGNQSIYWAMSCLTILGSIGFPILVNYRDMIVKQFRLFWHRLRHRRVLERAVHLADMNTKIVITAFGLLFIFGAVSFLVLEWDNTLAPFDLWGKVSQAVFNSTTPRSSGFVSVDPARFLSPTLIIVMFLMWIGGAAQSTGGGIKVNTFAAVCMNLRSIIRGQQTVNAFGRSISLVSLRRANAVVALSIISYALYSFTILLLEPDLPVKDLLFETASALFTVGSSLGVTSELSPASLVVLSTAMFIGRVGIISLLTGLVRQSPTGLRLPSGNIIIN